VAYVHRPADQSVDRVSRAPIEYPAADSDTEDQIHLATPKTVFSPPNTLPGPESPVADYVDQFSSPSQGPTPLAAPATQPAGGLPVAHVIPAVARLWEYPSDPQLLVYSEASRPPAA